MKPLFTLCAKGAGTSSLLSWVWRDHSELFTLHTLWEVRLCYIKFPQFPVHFLIAFLIAKKKKSLIFWRSGFAEQLYHNIKNSLGMMLGFWPLCPVSLCKGKILLPCFSLAIKPHSWISKTCPAVSHSSQGWPLLLPKYVIQLDICSPAVVSWASHPRKTVVW